MTHFTEDGGKADRLAPVTFLPGVVPAGAPAPDARGGATRTRGVAPARTVTFSEEYWAEDETVLDEPAARDAEPVDEAIDLDKQREMASTSLVRSLARRGLSISESRARLRADGLSDEDCSTVIADFIERGWLDDGVLAEQLIHTGVERKGQGRRALAMTLAKRGIARDVAEASLASLDDDDAERALEYARSKARSMHGVERDAALRRLSGQLARRGFPSSVAFTAARIALDETASPSHGVSFR